MTDKTSQSCWRVNNGFWRFLGGTRVARTSTMRRLRGQEGARKALGGIEKGEHSFTPQLYWGVFATRVSRGEFTIR